ncbi:MAG: hypothetical protein WC797_02390 [Candidatus Paceibacterota bacterium]|jgi:hypothetical protein
MKLDFWRAKETWARLSLDPDKTPLSEMGSLRSWENGVRANDIDLRKIAYRLGWTIVITAFLVALAMFINTLISKPAEVVSTPSDPIKITGIPTAVHEYALPNPDSSAWPLKRVVVGYRIYVEGFAIVTGRPAIDGVHGLLIANQKVGRLHDQSIDMETVANAARVAMGHKLPMTFCCDLIADEKLEGQPLAILYAADTEWDGHLKVSGRSWPEPDKPVGK